MVENNLSRNQRLAAVYFAVVPALVVATILIVYGHVKTAILFGFFAVVVYSVFIGIGRKDSERKDTNNVNH